MVPGVLVARLDAPLYFANIQWMEDKMVEYEADALRWVCCSPGRRCRAACAAGTCAWAVRSHGAHHTRSAVCSCAPHTPPATLKA
jgi:hypothetical protein